jgi:hypothetical protein
MIIENLFHIRAYDGSQHRAWEELSFQLREVPSNVTDVRKTRAPDGGVEWYYIFDDGHQEGFQAKFYTDLSSAIGDMKRSVETVATNRPTMSRLTFIVPFDLTDHATPKYQSEQDRWDTSETAWRETIPGADRLEIDLIRGGVVLDRLAKAEHAGRRAFWFEEFELTSDWFASRLTEVRAAVGKRYTPEAHTSTPIEDSLTAAALHPAFVEQLKTNVSRLIDSVTDVVRLSETSAVALEPLTERVQTQLNQDLRLLPLFDPHALEACINRLVEQLELVARSLDAGNDRRTREALGTALRHGRATTGFLRSIQCQAARTGILGVHGPAGQGKTHLLVAVAERLLAETVPVIVLLGQRFSDVGWWASVQNQLGLASVDVDTFLAALEACAEAADRRAAILIDALNESQNPALWRTELPALVSRIAASPWLSVAVTWRTDYAAILFGDNELAIPAIRHPGLAGLEEEALSRYCELYGLSPPIESALDPAFTNPLFLHLYCEARASGPFDASHVSRSAVFDAYATNRLVAVRDRLHLSPTAEAPKAAVQLVARKLGSNGGRPVPRQAIEPAVDSLALHLTAWPDTLFGALVSLGLLELTPTFPDGEVVGLPFQGFSDHVVVSQALIDAEANGPDWREAFLELIVPARALWPAIAVQLPERFAVELVDLLPTDELRSSWECRTATLDSFTDRLTSSFGNRAQELLEGAIQQEGYADDLLETVMRLAPRVGHPCNARWLHTRLASLKMPDRDATWGIDTWDVLWDSASFGRIHKWATRGGDVTASEEQTLLVAMLLTWLLISPNRPLRDGTTKALIELVRHRLAVIPTLLRSSAHIDDPYVSERVVLIAYGALVRNGDTSPSDARLVASELLRWFEDDIMPIHVLARDAGRGAITWALSRGLVATTAAKIVDSPYRAAPPDEPPTAESLEAEYGFIDEPRSWRCASILSSCLTWMGDFHKYVVEGDVGAFSWYPLSEPAPLHVSRYSDPRAEVDAEWAGRWIAARAIQSGWTPERFEAFERSRDLTSGRSAHKPERFGKKYQWQALHELLARLADNFHMSPDFDDVIRPYVGPGKWFGRDLDPSLGASELVNDALICRMGVGDLRAHWQLTAPDFASPTTAAEWVRAVDDLPAGERIAVSTDLEGTRWIALHRYSTWQADRRDAEGLDRSQWLLLFSWLACPGDAQRLFDLLGKQTQFGRWMPERERPERSYLGEGPWCVVDQAEPDDWMHVNQARPGAEGIAVMPSSATYLWEGVTQDCSLDESVNLEVPASLLLEGLQWDGTEPRWLHGERTVAEAFRSTNAQPDRNALLVEEAWLSEFLGERGLSLVQGYLAERRASSPDRGSEDIHFWTEISGAAKFDTTSGWSLLDRLVDVRQATA